ncbi:MAG: histidine--tRNA ligase [Flammeovirgaceae bacterium]|nr:histidine--tRNA ligase [Flammeovirgaceae bacterium]
MNKVKPSLAKGTRDFGPEEMEIREYVINIFKNIFDLFGFRSIQTPSIENIDTLTGNYGDEGDKLIFRILNSGDFLKKSDQNDFKESLKLKSKISSKALRYDLTVPLARFVSMNQEKISIPFKRYQIQPVWRADRPQKGRFREFYQCDVDYIGTNSIVCEAEIIDLVYTLFDKLKIYDIDFKLNNRKILQGIAEVNGLSDNFNELCVLIDKIDKIGLEKFEKELIRKDYNSKTVKSITEIFNFNGSNLEKINFIEKVISSSQLGKDGVKEIKKLMDVNDNFTIDFSLARGLSYYTSSIFEVKSNKSNIGSLCGGGRYDNLTENFGLKDMPGIGISFGIERIFELLKEKKDPVLQDGKNKILLSYLDSRYLPNCLVIAKKLRDEGISVDLISDNLKLKKQLKYANKNNIPFVMIVGEDEIKSNSFTFKSMDNGKQVKNSIDEIISTMKSLKSNE